MSGNSDRGESAPSKSIVLILLSSTIGAIVGCAVFLLGFGFGAAFASYLLTCIILFVALQIFVFSTRK